MKLSTARKLVCMSYFMVPGMQAILATATRIVYNGETKRFLFPDGSVLESNKGHWKAMKNPKLEAAVRRFGKGPFVTGGYTGSPIRDEFSGVVQHLETIVCDCNQGRLPCTCKAPKPFISETTLRLKMEVIALQELCNEKDEQIDKAARPMVVRLDWWAVGLVAVVLVAHYVFKVL